MVKNLSKNYAPLRQNVLPHVSNIFSEFREPILQDFFGFVLEDTVPEEARKAIHGVFAARIHLNDCVVMAFRLLIKQGFWSEAVKLAVDYGGFSQAEISRSTRVMRSTVARWYNGETNPPEALLSDYSELIITAISAVSTELKSSIINNYKHVSNPGGVEIDASTVKQPLNSRSLMNELS
jgi:transcriptional regulator with XRE-family HTH domain